MTQPSNLSSQELQTRQHIYETAITLFREQGYDKTTIEDIVASADVSIELINGYFARKEDIVMVLYSDHVTELIEYMKTRPRGQLTDRYNAVLEQMLNSLTPNRLALMSLFGSAMRPDSDLSLMGTDNKGHHNN